MKNPLLNLSLICIIAFTGCKKGEDLLTYEYILTKVEKAYDNFTSYRDTGVVTANYVSSNSYTVVKRFKTAYRNTGLFRFEYFEEGNEDNYYIIYQDINKKVQSWWGISSQVSDEEDIAGALAAATGVSDMTAFIIPGFLFPVEFERNNSFRILTDISLGASETIHGKECYVINGYNLFSDLCKIYIQKDNYLIRRFTDNHNYDTFDFSRVIDYYPEMNISIPDADLLFNIP